MKYLAGRIFTGHDALLAFEFSGRDGRFSRSIGREVYVTLPRGVVRSAKAFTRIMKEIDWEAEGFIAAVTTGPAVGVVGDNEVRPGEFQATLYLISDPPRGI